MRYIHLVFILLVHRECLAIRLLFGRPLDRHGFLGLPFSKKLEKGQEFDGVDGSDDELIPEQWFHQRLDHFDLTNRNLWKQVTI